MNKYKCDLPIAAIDTLKSQSYMLSFDTGHIMVHIETIMFMNSFVDLEINLNVKKKNYFDTKKLQKYVIVHR